MKRVLDLTVCPRHRRNQAMTLEDPLRVGVADEDGFPAGIQKDAVGRLRSDAPDAEELFPEDGQLLGAHHLDVSGVFLPEKPDERLEPLCLDVIIARRSDDLGQCFLHRSGRVPREREDRFPFNAEMAFSTFVQAVFWVRIAPTITSKGASAGHQWRSPKCPSKSSYILNRSSRQSIRASLRDE